ncbi:MAG: hypothetical protein LBM67_02515 [Lentimicrobiaceae bacterium]|jgi:hypothetical protein|nr:hypothetical protein [Lentimicrobiaceae bacterium]
MQNTNVSAGSQVALSAVLGGTVEALGGGKFANGAVTGAFVMLFNHLQHEPDKKKVESRARYYKNLKEGILDF